MEHSLRCNSLKCRKELNSHAVVTTCSHIFCIECSHNLHLARQNETQRPVCPACQAQLPNPDDIVVTNLNPTEDYKTSVLSGLSPQIIMECAGRALSFWAYQTTQEVVYHEYLVKSLSEKYANLNTQLDKVIHDANSEISNLRNRISTSQTENDQIKHKNEELNQALRDKNRKLLQTQELYDKLKRRSMLGKVQSAAFDAVDDTIQASVAANRYSDAMVDPNMRPPPPPLFSDHQSTGKQRIAVHDNGMRAAPPNSSAHEVDQGSWNGPGSVHTSQLPIQTPSTHRQHLTSITNSFPSGIGIPYPHNLMEASVKDVRSTPRQPLTHTVSNAASTGFSGYGMSAGMRVSNSTGPGASGMRPVNRSRVAQRSSSGFAATNPASNLGAPITTSNMFSNGLY